MALLSAPKTERVRTVVTSSGGGDTDGDGDGWTDGEFWAAAGICIAIACVIVVVVAAVLIVRCRQGAGRDIAGPTQSSRSSGGGDFGVHDDLVTTSRPGGSGEGGSGAANRGGKRFPGSPGGRGTGAGKLLGTSGSQAQI